ncbi:MAG: glycosyltransferase [Thermoguttaceae bacterium]
MSEPTPLEIRPAETTRKTTIVVPCFNEEQRLGADGFRPLLERSISLLFVDDGSKDGTLARLEEICRQLGPQAAVMAFPRNQGKAEAVRQGMLLALGMSDAATSDCRAAFFRDPSPAIPVQIVGYLDADLATPAREMLRLLERIDQGDVDVVMGARVKLLGTDIRRRAVRHYLGRVFATLASMILKLAVYDTQCGAKLFRRTEALEAALSDRFLSRWVFDVELLGRLVCGTADVPGLDVERIIEVPLNCWHDIRGSKVGLKDSLPVLIDLLRIWSSLSRHKQADRPSRRPAEESLQEPGTD